MIEKIKGRCLCGSVQFKCDNVFREFHFCHCTQCQKISGSAHVANLFSNAGTVEFITGLGNVQRYDVPGRALSNAFCKQCGSSVPYFSKFDKSMIVPAGLLEGTPNIVPQDNIFWNERACWYDDGVKSKKCSTHPE